MRRFLLLSLTLFCACAPTKEHVYVTPYVPAELRTPIPKPDRAVSTLRDVALVLIDYDEALGGANSKITAIDAILTKSEAADGSGVLPYPPPFDPFAQP